MAYTSRMTYGTLSSFSSASMSGTYQSLGLLSNAASIVKVINDTTEAILISIDGINDHEYVPAGSFFLYDVSSDTPGSTAVFMPQGTKYFVKGTAGTGSVYLIYLYPIQT